jgi:pyridoxine 4-dehydrogenase
VTDDTSAARAGSISIGDVRVSRLGLGTNRLTNTPAAAELLHRAVALGVDFIDTAHGYGAGASETTIATVLAPYDGGLVVTTKGGYADGSPENLRRELEDSLSRLRVSTVTLYQLHRVDSKVPLEESVGVLSDLRNEGKIRHIGLSEVTVEQLEAAQRVAPIVSVQNEYNVLVRKYEPVLDYCTSNDIVFMPWFPLGGLMGGAQQVEARLAATAVRYEVSAQQIALAWLLRRSPMMLPIPGTLSVAHLEENIGAASIVLSDEDYGEFV